MSRKTALVTGSARGIGRAIALRLARDGYQVVIHGVSDSANARQVKQLIEENGGTAQIMPCDLTDLGAVSAFCEHLPPIDVLVLNASLQYRTPWQEITEQACREQLNCNFVSSMLLIQAVVNHMKACKWGRIITIGSVQEAKPHPDMLVYAASKSAQTNMMRSLSLQLAKDGITVNNVAPGVIYTDRNVEALRDPVYAKKVTDTIPAGFYGAPEDCAGIVSLLCSDEGRYITGQSIFVDGGKCVQ
jgi:NAD(P)-dependent dehydrogenase (short-subunit alcohol dehydrogenase family)